MSALFRLSTPDTCSLFCCVQERQEMVNRGPGWSPRSQDWTHCKSADRRRALFNSTCVAAFSPFCSVACLWLPESMELPSYILKGLLRNPPVCSFFIQPALLSLFTSECQSLPLFLPHFCIPPFNSCFFLTLLHLPTLLQPPPLLYHTTLFQIFPCQFFFYLLFCRLKLRRASLKALSH